MCPSCNFRLLLSSIHIEEFAVARQIVRHNARLEKALVAPIGRRLFFVARRKASLVASQLEHQVVRAERRAGIPARLDTSPFFSAVIARPSVYTALLLPHSHERKLPGVGGAAHSIGKGKAQNTSERPD